MEPIKIQKVIDYIEENLTDDLSYDAIAAMMAISEADLQRSFKTITGMTISEYIRNRRLSCAAIAIKNENMKIVDAALLYGYQTAEGFGKAFKQYHGCTPLEAKSPESTIRYFNPVVIKLAKRGGILMDYEPHQEKADSVTAYYDASDELHRLTRSKHAYLEYFVTMQYLEKVIPQNSSILDCCAGTGVYAFELAKKHRVVASDLSGKHVRQMREIQKGKPVLEAVYQLDVCRMDCFEDESFDVVLCLGALYHIFSEEARIKAVQECKRVCKKGGILAFAYLNKWGNFYNGMINNLKSMEQLYREFESGNNEDIFYRTTAEEIESLCGGQGLECIYNIGVDHLAFLSSEKIDAMNEQEYQKILEYQLKASAERNIAGTSLHGLWIGKK